MTAAQMRSEKKARKKEREATFKVGERVARQVVPAAAPVVAAGAARVRSGVQSVGAAISSAARTRVGLGVGAATVGIGTAAAAAVLAGVASYYATTWLMSKLPRRPTLEDVRFNAAVAQGKARRDAAARLGRPLTPDELTSFADAWRVKLAEIERRFR